jgi:hypothetical protein
MNSWRNWSGLTTTAPTEVHTPTTTEDVVAVVN